MSTVKYISVQELGGSELYVMVEDSPTVRAMAALEESQKKLPVTFVWVSEELVLQMRAPIGNEFGPDVAGELLSTPITSHVVGVTVIWAEAEDLAAIIIPMAASVTRIALPDLKRCARNTEFLSPSLLTGPHPF